MIDNKYFQKDGCFGDALVRTRPSSAQDFVKAFANVFMNGLTNVMMNAMMNVMLSSK